MLSRNNGVNERMYWNVMVVVVVVVELNIYPSMGSEIRCLDFMGA